MVSKDCIVNCSLLPLPQNSDEDWKSLQCPRFCRTVWSTRNHWAYIFSNIDDGKLLREPACFCRAWATLVHMNDIPALDESRWGSMFARIDRCVAVGYFTANEVELNSGGQLVLEGFANVWYLPKVFFGKLEALPLHWWKALTALYTVVYNWFSSDPAMVSGDVQDSWRAIFNAGN